LEIPEFAAVQLLPLFDEQNTPLSVPAKIISLPELMDFIASDRIFVFVRPESTKSQELPPLPEI
jgi:hypothetical protein